MRTDLFLAIAAGVGAIALAVHERDRLRQIILPLWAQTIHDAAYGPYPENRVDIMRPRWNTRALRPAVVVFHGGAWANGSKADMRDRVCLRYLQKGFVVANVEYRQGSIAAAAQDAARALRWFSQNASAYGGDRDRIVVTGESAGGHLALLAAFQSGVQAAAVVNFYGVTDLTALIDRPFVRAVLPEQDPDLAAREFSPVTYVRRGLPAVLSIHGTADTVVPPAQTAALTRSIREAGGEASEFYIKGGIHGLSPEQQEIAYRAVFRFLSGLVADPRR
jgi:acetyl esterase/lipase